MSNGLSPTDKRKTGLAAVGASETDLVISNDFGISAGGALNLRIDLEVSGTTVTNAITVNLQGRSPGGSFVDLAGANAAVSITGDGTFSLRQNVEVAADQPNMPLPKQLQVVITTGVADAVTVDKIYVQQPL